ncbi:hypothetical protein RYZ20_15540 [Thioclava sp. A2]|uniref:hypothetical protein n=1 Tax=Thioclava sp. FCG-A2 TaxID=3080562 RepID=UPI002955D76D|nr:hypothetical protein [Thioclava sp. A2]MDV7272303.1 hypothetical protein [Thioclava sp. A2]
MAYKVGTTIVIDDSGNVDWSRIANKPAIGAGTLTSVTVVNSAITGGAYVAGTSGTNIVYNCYIDSLSGGGTAGDVTVTGVRKGFNCNCNCRC